MIKGESDLIRVGDSGVDGNSAEGGNGSLGGIIAGRIDVVNDHIGALGMQCFGDR